MNESYVIELIKTGGIVGGALLTLIILVVMLKYIIPLFKPNGQGSVTSALQQLSHLPEEIKILTVEIRNFNNVVETHVPTKAELLKQFEENRHDVRNIVAKGTSIIEDKLNEFVERRKFIRRKERRK